MNPNFRRVIEGHESLTIHNFTVAVLKNFDKPFLEGR